MKSPVPTLFLPSPAALNVTTVKSISILVPESELYLFDCNKGVIYAAIDTIKIFQINSMMRIWKKVIKMKMKLRNFSSSCHFEE